MILNQVQLSSWVQLRLWVHRIERELYAAGDHRMLEVQIDGKKFGDALHLLSLQLLLHVNVLAVYRCTPARARAATPARRAPAGAAVASCPLASLATLLLPLPLPATPIATTATTTTTAITTTTATRDC